MRPWIHVLLLVSALAATTSANIRGTPAVSGTTKTYVGCTIRSKQFAKPLYAAGNKFKTGQSRRVFLWMPSSSSAVRAETKWTLTSHDAGKTYTIKSNEWNEYLYSSAATFDSSRREVYTHPSVDGSAKWTITSHERGRYLTIVNAKSDGYLFADGEKSWDAERRRVFIDIPIRSYGSGRYRWEECKWEIDC